MIHNIIKISCLLLLIGLSHLSVTWAGDDNDAWVLKTTHYSLSRELLNDTLSARGFSAEALSAKQQNALLQELFIRESLLAEQSRIPTEMMQAFENKLNDYRRGQLAKLTLDVLSESGMPDFSKRARELYEVRKDEQYQLPLRLRVRVLQKTLSGEPDNDSATVKTLEALLSDIKADKLDFKQAVLEHSDDPKRTLAGGDSFWFQQGQKPARFFENAKALTAAKPYSEVFIHDTSAYILQFIGRQEPVERSFTEVKEEILSELKKQYREEQRKLLLTELRERFQNDVEVNPDFKQ